jgi:hypothetical protein
VFVKRKHAGMRCKDCSSSSFRLSRWRWSDLERLALLQYPVRCRVCHRRTYAGLPLALALYQARKARKMREARQAGR